MAEPGQDLPMGCVWALLLVLGVVVAWSIVSEFARDVAWIRWAFG